MPTSSAPTVASESGFSSFALRSVLTDRYGSEVTWTLVEQCSNTEVASGGPYADNVQFYESYCIEDGLGYLFTIYDSAYDGIGKS